MKSAEEWAAIIDSDDDYEKDKFLETYPTFADMIRAIQRDAIQVAADKAIAAGSAMSSGYKEHSCPHCKDGEVASNNTAFLIQQELKKMMPQEPSA